MQTRRIYCVIPPELADRLHDQLRAHFAASREVEVVVERRARDRRSGAERRAEAEPGFAPDRRRVRNAAGRRIAERRAPAVPLGSGELPKLPRRAARHAEQLVFVERAAPSTEAAEDADTARLVTRIQAGESAGFAELYLRYFDRVYSYLRLLLRDQHEAEDITQQVFTQVLEALPRYERRRQPFRAWLFVIARNQALNHLRKLGRVSTEPAPALERRRENASRANGDHEAFSAQEVLDWVTDPDLLVLVERLPEPQRNVLALRFMLGLSHPEIARVLGRSEVSVRVLQSRALAFLRDRLRALGHSPRRGERARMRHFRRQAPVLRSRRWVLNAPPGAVR